MKKYLKEMIFPLLPLFVAVTLTTGAAYTFVQQNYRMAANDPQVQYVHDIKNVLETGGAQPTDITGQEKIDPEASLDPFIIIFDKDKKAVASSATLADGIPVPPTGTFTSNKTGILVRKTEENRFTWQPKKNVRIAAVLIPYKGGYILAGRSMKEVEKRILDLTVLAGAAWLFTILAVTATAILIRKETK